MPVVQRFVVLLGEQPVALEPGQFFVMDRSQFVDVLAGEVEGFAGVEPALRAEVFLQRDMRHHGRIDQHCAETKGFGQMGGVVAAEG